MNIFLKVFSSRATMLMSLLALILACRAEVNSTQNQSTSEQENYAADEVSEDTPSGDDENDSNSSEKETGDNTSGVDSSSTTSGGNTGGESSSSQQTAGQESQSQAAQPIFTYQQPRPVYTRGVAISPNLPVILPANQTYTYSIAPALPAGLVLDTTTGAISGSASAFYPTVMHTITASGAGGQVDFSIPITVMEENFVDDDYVADGFAGGTLDREIIWDGTQLILKEWLASDVPIDASADPMFAASDIVAAWHFDGSGSVANSDPISEIKGVGNGSAVNGDGSNMNYIAGQVDSALELDGANDYVQVAHSASLDLSGREITLMAFVYNAGQGNDHAIFCKGDNSTTFLMLGIVAAEAPTFRVMTTNGQVELQNNDHNLATDKWYHIAGTYDGSSMKIFVNGQKTLEQEHVGDIVNDSSDVFIGKRCNNDNRYFNGAIDELVWLNRTISEDEILRYYERLTERYLDSGSFTSRVFDSGNDLANWNEISWTPDAPHQKPLLDADVESDYPSGNHNPSAFDTGLVGRWILQGNAGELVSKTADAILDLSDNGLHGSVQSSDDSLVYSEDTYAGLGADFDADDDHITVAYDAALNAAGAAFTIAGWVNIRPSVANDYAVACYGAANDVYMLGVNGFSAATRGTINFRITTDNGFQRLDGGKIPLGEWIHIAGTYDGTNMKTFINGVYDTEISQTGNMLTQSAVLKIGKRCNDERNIPAKIGQVAIWNRVLSDAELFSLGVRVSQNLRLQVRSCRLPSCNDGNFVGPDGSPASYYSERYSLEPGLPEFNIQNLAPGRYFQYKVLLNSSHDSYAPGFNRVSIKAIP